jgi:hypothetical protein
MLHNSIKIILRNLTMTKFFALPLLVLVASILSISSFSFPRFQIPKYSFDTEKITQTGRKSALIGAGILATCCLNLNGIAPAFADLASDDSAEIESVAPRAMKITSQADDISQVQKKSALVKGSTKPDAPVGEDRSYSNSLKKEQAIQESRKRTKAERAKDMCEMMGRGC